MKEILIPKTEYDRYFKANKEIYQETIAKAKEKFGNSLAYKTIINGIYAEGKGSQFFFNNEMHLYLPKNQKVISLEDLERIYSSQNVNNFFDGSFYTDTNDLILRTEIPSYHKNKQILKYLVKQVRNAGYEFSSEKPLKINGLESIKDNDSENQWSLLLRLGKDTKIQNDERFAYSKNRIQLGNKITNLDTKENGLSGVCLDRNGDLGTRYGNLADSSDDGRVVIKEFA